MLLTVSHISIGSLFILRLREIYVLFSLTSCSEIFPFIQSAEVFCEKAKCRITSTSCKAVICSKN